MNWIKELLGLKKAAAPVPIVPPSTSDSPPTIDELVTRYDHLYRPALHLVSCQSGGFSRLGGLPQMPGEVAWPMWQEKSLAFLAQLSLAELHASLPSYLPSSGFLFFFFNQDQEGWDYDPNNFGGWRVMYSAEDCTALAERAAPGDLSAEFIYHPAPVTPRRIDLLPDSEGLPRPEFDWSRDGEAYSELRHSPFGEFRHHQVLGYPSPVQNDDMEKECQFAFNGISAGRYATGYHDPRVTALEAGIRDWKLLLQLESDDKIGWKWGDAGSLYFWVREQDAGAGDFSNVWMVFQCC